MDLERAKKDAADLKRQFAKLVESDERIKDGKKGEAALDAID